MLLYFYNRFTELTGYVFCLSACVLLFLVSKMIFHYVAPDVPLNSNNSIIKFILQKLVFLLAAEIFKSEWMAVRYPKYPLIRSIRSPRIIISAADISSPPWANNVHNGDGGNVISDAVRGQ
jgi:hypothetical protein